jgi:lysophospholipase L1-like esterase
MEAPVAARIPWLPTLAALLLLWPLPQAPAQDASAPNAANATAVPLTDLQGAHKYKGFSGGLYAEGNEVPAEHRAAGLAAAAMIQPLDEHGKPSPSGKIVFLGIGMSNATMEFRPFMMHASQDSRVNHRTLVLVNGAQGATTACFWVVASGPPPGCGGYMPNQYDRVRDEVLRPAGVTEQQVQILWIKNANPGPAARGGFRPLCDPGQPGCKNDPGATEALRYERQLGQMIRAARSRYPHLQQIFLASRIYAGYATTALNPEPFAYEYGFSVKWLIQAQVTQMRDGKIDAVAGDLSCKNGAAAWTAWGPYLWADGEKKRSDGLSWSQDEFDPKDYTHPNAQGRQKVARLLMDFFLSSAFTAWFRAS